MIIEPGTLRSLPLFSTLIDDEEAEFGSRTQAVTFDSQQTIYRAEDTTHLMYMVLVSKVRLFVTSKYGKSRRHCSSHAQRVVWGISWIIFGNLQTLPCLTI